VYHWERVKKCKYGECILYSQMKIKQRNLLKLFLEGVVGDEGE
jgi:hypothetical protein